MIRALTQRWSGLSSRERAIVATGSVLMIACILFVLVVDPLLDKLDRLGRQTIRKQRDIQELAALGVEYSAKRARLVELETKMPAAEEQFSLLAFLEDAAKNAQVRDRITGMQPQSSTLVQTYQETAVDLRLDGVQLPQLLNMLVAIANAPYDIQVRQLQIKTRFDNPGNLDVALRVVAYAKAG